MAVKDKPRMNNGQVIHIAEVAKDHKQAEFVKKAGEVIFNKEVAKWEQKISHALEQDPTGQRVHDVIDEFIINHDRYQHEVREELECKLGTWDITHSEKLKNLRNTWTNSILYVKQTICIIWAYLGEHSLYKKR